MEELVEQIPLPEGVIDVLLKRPGPYGAFIELVTASEGDRERLATLAGQMQLSAVDVNRAHLAALGWVQRLPI